MPSWLDAGLLIDIALAAILVEAAVLFATRGRWSHRVRPLGVAANMAAGTSLLAAAKAAASGAEWTWLAGALALALVAHVLDLGSRLGLIGHERPRDIRHRSHDAQRDYPARRMTFIRRPRGA